MFIQNVAAIVNDIQKNNAIKLYLLYNPSFPDFTPDTIRDYVLLNGTNFAVNLQKQKSLLFINIH